jgi:prevent-host-death family protein
MKAKRVGIRELRQNLSQYLERVAAGERFEVTERNLPVTILAPLPGRSSARERLIAAGRSCRPDSISPSSDLRRSGPTA